MCIEIRTIIQTCDMTYICLGDIQAVVVVCSPLIVHGCNFAYVYPTYVVLCPPN